MNRRKHWWLAILAVVVCYCVLSFYRIGAAQSGSVPTLANAPKDRQAMIANLEEIKNLLKEQNDLLRSGKVKVVIVKETND